jgi:hypothetical protein
MVETLGIEEAAWEMLLTEEASREMLVTAVMVVMVTEAMGARVEATAVSVAVVHLAVVVAVARTAVARTAVANTAASAARAVERWAYVAMSVVHLVVMRATANWVAVDGWAAARKMVATTVTDTADAMGNAAAVTVAHMEGSVAARVMMAGLRARVAVAKTVVVLRVVGMAAPTAAATAAAQVVDVAVRMAEVTLVVEVMVAEVYMAAAMAVATVDAVVGDAATVASKVEQVVASVVVVKYRPLSRSCDGPRFP